MMNNQAQEMSSSKNKQQRLAEEDDGDDDDDHENDMVMPGFRFHPTEEELVEFYLRRKFAKTFVSCEPVILLHGVDFCFLVGFPFNSVNNFTKALAAIGEKEWFFYVPRDRKYRNGDRPNRVTTSGYWKATGADRMIRTENFRSIGLKKTLVFYSGKAPKGIRTSWIMNEYRLPQHETERLQKAEISLCRVYKRAGVEDHPSVPRSTLQTSRATSSTPSSNANKLIRQNSISFEPQTSNQNDDKLSETSGNSTTDIVGTALGLSSTLTPTYTNYVTSFPTMAATLPPHTSSLLPPTASSSIFSNNTVDDLHRIISYQQASVNNLASQTFPIQSYQHKLSSNMVLQPQSQLQLQQQQQAVAALNNLAGEVQGSFPDRLWEWNPIPGDQESKDYTNPFK
ncbi:hypothetical protein SSX86_005278 [Deinandra increscens subsp. villosa]|uniref:NAC domain-containing protein n=1 Tax=Deinandra increscens subsp. villosa TaxID=3103831 RepID=A0AAP0DTN3_9ASTR